MKRLKVLFLTILFIIFVPVGVYGAINWSVDASYIVLEESGKNILFPDVIRQSPTYIEGWYGIDFNCTPFVECGRHNSLTHYPSGEPYCPQERQGSGWNYEEFSVPSVLYSSTPVFRNPDDGIFYNYIASMLGQDLGCLDFHAEFAMVGILFSNDGKTWQDYSVNPVLDDDEITRLINDDKTHSVLMFDMIYEDGKINAFVFAPDTDICNIQQTDPNETYTWILEKLENTDGVHWAVKQKVSGNGITVNPDNGYPGPWLQNLRVAYDDYYYYLSRHDAYNFLSECSDRPDKGEIYRIQKSEVSSGTWEKLVEFGCDTAFPLVGDTRANEGSSFESDGSGRLKW